MPALPNLDPQVRRFLADSVGRPPEDLGPVLARAEMRAGQATGPPPPAAELTDLTLPVGPSGAVDVRVVRAIRIPRQPAVVYLHGGGWVMGDRHTHDRTVRQLAATSGAAIVVVDYTRAPEARFPTALEESYAVTAWIAENGRDVDLDTSRLAVAGDSSGGNLATATALLATRRQGPRLAAQVLFYPTLEAEFDTTSYHRYGAGDYFLSTRTMRWFWDQYAPDDEIRRDPLAAPLRADDADLAALPPTLLITAEADVLRDDGERYAGRLAAAGVSLTAVRYQGTIHAFTVLSQLAGTPAAVAALDQAGRSLARAFAR